MQRFTVELIPDEEQGGFTARVPDIPAYGEGETEDEAMADLKEALLCYVESFGLNGCYLTQASSASMDRPLPKLQPRQSV